MIDRLAFLPDRIVAKIFYRSWWARPSSYNWWHKAVNSWITWFENRRLTLAWFLHRHTGLCWASLVYWSLSYGWGFENVRLCDWCDYCGRRSKAKGLI